jgi:hypothetical protein
MNRHPARACATALAAASALSLPVLAQAPPTLPSQTVVVPTDPSRPRAAGPQQEALQSYQACVAAHRKEVDLHNAAHAIVDLRDNREHLERALAADPAARARAPGGVDGVLAQSFARYKALGGPAATVAAVTELPAPCPAPTQAFSRSAPAASASPIAAHREMAVAPGTFPQAAMPAEPPRIFTPAAGPPMRRTLEEAWLAYVMAIRSTKEIDLQKTMSSYYFATTRNNFARSGRTLTPENVGALGRFLPDLNTTRYVTVLEKGPTAALVHARDSTQVDSGNKPRVEYLFFRFANEGSGWKVDGFGILHALKHRDDGSPAPFKLPDNPSPDFRIDGRLRAAPPLTQK